MSESKLKDKFKLFLILEAVLIPGIFIISVIVNLVNGSRIITNVNAYYYGVGVIVMLTAVPSLYRRPYSKKGIYRKMLGEMFSFKNTGHEQEYVEAKPYEDENPFATGIFIVLVGVVLLLIGFIIERVFSIM